MRFKSSLAVVSLALAGLVYSCKKDVAPQHPQTSTATVSQLARTANSNPYNHLGELHNGAMDALAVHPGLSSLTLEQRHEVIQDFLQQQAGTTRIAFSEIKDGVLYAIDPANAQNFAAYLQQQGVPADVCADIALMQNKFSSWPSDDLNGFEDSLSAFEEYITGKYGTSNFSLNSSLDLYSTAGKSAYLLIGTSILRNSLSYWSTNLKNPQSPWFDPQTANRPFFDRVWSDVKGFFGGLRGGGGSTNGSSSNNSYFLCISCAISSSADASSGD